MTRRSSFKVRDIAAGEHSLCARIYHDAWNNALPDILRFISPTDIESETQGERIFVGVLDKEISGYVSVWEPDCFIHHLYVDPSAQRSGLGRALVARVEALVGRQPITLKCQLANTGAMRFYLALGFEESSDVGADEYGRWIRLVKR